MNVKELAHYSKKCHNRMCFTANFSHFFLRYNPMQAANGITPIMPPSLLILKTTITSFVSQDSVEMSKIHSLGTMVEWNSQPLISTTTIGEETALRPRKIIMEEGDGGSTFVDWSASRAHSMALTFDGILWVFDQRGWWLKASERNPKTPRHFAMTCLAH